MTAAIPDLDPLDDVSSILESAGGLLDMLAHHLSGMENVGTGVVHTAEAAAFLVRHAREKANAVHSAALAYQHSVMEGC